jgi:hypothetical protein
MASEKADSEAKLAQEESAKEKALQDQALGNLAKQDQEAAPPGQTTVLTRPSEGDRPTPDPVTAQILDALSHPTQAEIEANDITVSGGAGVQPSIRNAEIHRLILHFSVNGQSIEVIAGCSTLDDRDCHTFGELGDPSSLACGPGGDPKVRVCTTKGSRTFQIEANKKEHGYFVYPVEGGKPNRRYKIPLASINDKVVVMDY